MYMYFQLFLDCIIYHKLVKKQKQKNNFFWGCNGLIAFLFQLKILPRFMIISSYK